MKKLKVTEMARLDHEGYKASRKLPLVIVLDDVRSMNNIGSVFRSADAFRLEGLYLCGITARPPHPDIHKTALGAEDSVSWRYAASADDAVAELLREGYKVYALEQAHGSISLEQFAPIAGDRYALVLGNEVKGVRQSVVDICTGCIEIPQFGTKHSLNVSVAAGIAIWQFARPLLSLLQDSSDE
ncbi:MULTISPECIES: RNA methyltransferase [unclassified Porphyromonas]|uniref:RNA methyltransferase n=1 Tax=unclassified Porphyromonas TaxID=2645799 RepID=UPI00052B94B1|nr:MULTISPECIES: RNA methyltransferase [unclassified Porphyromonas]KGN86726.1 RNA methyltransferase [Porphyromonas sp. COT-290 OH860]KGO01383.1 RNA methyltransferase [Porphyromonas sp. COT-290 OH3588]